MGVNKNDCDFQLISCEFCRNTGISLFIFGVYNWVSGKRFLLIDLILDLCQKIKINLHIIYPLGTFNFFTNNKIFICTYIHLCINIYISGVEPKIRGVYPLIIFT
ncbi:hypothetical protein CN315_08450 [Bacillus cereus]|nr:hypothetical protein CN391_18780 [Bacillus anthracis]PFF09338.1 hypothetical protein CN315_08450 [Bacillus cereus]PGQ80556.1 hypothetical protein COA15_18520 [Bacillus anthracis]